MKTHWKYFKDQKVLNLIQEKKNGNTNINTTAQEVLKREVPMHTTNGPGANTHIISVTAVTQVHNLNINTSC